MLRDHCLALERVDASFTEGGRYARTLDLPAIEVDEALVHRVGAAGGFSEGGDCEDHSRVEAGWPFFGRYVQQGLARIVGKVLVGIISRDPEFCLAVDLDCNPTLPAHGDGFRLRDILVPA